MTDNLPKLATGLRWEDSFIYDAVGNALPAADYVRAYGLTCRKAALIEAAELCKKRALFSLAQELLERAK